MPVQQRKKPGLVITLAICNFAIAVLGMPCCCWMSGQYMEDTSGFSEGSPFSQREWATSLYQEHPVIKISHYLDLGLRFLFTVLLIVSGIGLLLVHQWGRILALVYALLSMLHKGVMILFMLAFMLPASRSGVDSDKALVSLIFYSFLYLISMLYPFLVFVVLFLPSIRKAFRASPERKDREEESEWEQE